MLDRHTRRRGGQRPGQKVGGPRPLKHGLKALEARLKNDTLDGRSQTARMLRTIAEDLAGDRGGWEHCTAAERILIERCAAVTLLCSSIEAFVFRQGSPVTANGELLAVLRKGYVSHFAALTRALSGLGLRPDRPPKDPSLEAYLAARTAESSCTTTAADEPPQPEEDEDE